MNRVVLLFIAVLCPFSGNAEQLFPEPQDIIASWQPLDKSLTASQANQILNDANTLNNAGYGIIRVEQTLAHRQQSGELPPELRYIKARVLQRNHQFEAAASILSDLSDPSSSLLKATIFNNLGQFDQAINACKSLTGKVSHTITLTCLLDARYQQDPDTTFYEQLRRIVSSTRGKLSESQKIWVNSTLAAMALDQNDPSAALQYLDNVSVTGAPLSTLALWAEAHLQLNQAEAVLRQLGNQVTTPASADDAILLALARASKISQREDKWQTLASERIAERKWREDWSHAAYIAEYHLYLDNDPEQARYYAGKNWEQAKGLADRRLLELTDATGESL